MSFETDAHESHRRRSLEQRELSQEERETKEGESDAELKRAAALERADYLNKEIKTSQKQMQNIMLHIQQVTAAIRALREQLQLVGSGDDPSVARDREKVIVLKQKIVAYQDEIFFMRHDLIREQMEELKNGIGVGMSTDELQRKAEEMVNRMLETLTKSDA